MPTEERTTGTTGAACREACPVCDGRVVERRSKLVCERCHAIVETCCDGGRQGV
jgi:hypothetical protein